MRPRSLLLFAVYAAHAPAHAQALPFVEDVQKVVIHVDSFHRTTSENFLGVTLDSCYIDRYNLKDPEFIRLASRLNGAVLRVGGTDADRIFLQMPDGAQPYSDDHLVPLGIPGTPPYKVLNVSIFDDLYAFAKATGTKLLWDINALGTRLSNNTWDSTNTRQLLSYIKTNGYHTEGVLVGFQFGNEPFLNYYNPIIKGDKPPKLVTGANLGKDVKELKKILVQEGLGGMWLQANDACCYPTDYVYSSEFIGEVKGVPDLQFSFHLYPQDSSCDPAHFVNGNADPAGIAYYQNMAKTWGFQGKVILSETSAHNAGCNGVSDRFVHTLWFVDYLGRAADDHGVWQLYRQSLFTPTSYGLVTTDGPNIKAVTPDYYTAVLWHKLVGRLLQIDGRHDGLRVYAACLPSSTALAAPDELSGKVTLIYANFDESAANISLMVESNGSTGLYTGRVAEYRLESAGDWLDPNMKLNGVQLIPNSTLEPRLTNATGDAIALAGRTLGFFVLQDANSSVCSGA